jgi:hypothetical protein
MSGTPHADTALGVVSFGLSCVIWYGWEPVEWFAAAFQGLGSFLFAFAAVYFISQAYEAFKSA